MRFDERKIGFRQVKARPAARISQCQTSARQSGGPRRLHTVVLLPPYEPPRRPPSSGIVTLTHPSVRNGWKADISEALANFFEPGKLLLLSGEAGHLGRMLVMSGRPGMLRQQRMVGIACALAATCLGIAYLTAAGAPASHSVVNGVAFLLGVVALVGIGGAMPQITRYSGPVLLVMGLSLIATALLGAAADGASRWIMIGPLSVQVSLVLVPFMAVTFARCPTLAGCLGIAVVALALALQPDRAMAGVLAFGMAVLAITRPSSLSASALTVAITAFLVSMMRTDMLPAVPYVDQILFTAFDVHILAGAAVWLGALLLLVPPILGWRGNEGLGHAYLVFGAVWLGCIAAAALGNYPTPVVGYGGSAILGYLLTFSFLPPGTGSANEHAAAADEDGAATSAELHRSAALA